MNIADMTLDELYAEKARIEGEDTIDVNALNLITNRISELEFAQDLNQRHEERVQAQEEIIASIVLPHDFNDLFDNAAANDIIKELIQQMKRQDYQEHNAEIVLLETSYKDKLRAADDREAQLQRQNDDLQKQSQALSDEIADLKRSELEALAQAAEANRGRDLLAKELEVTKGEIAGLLQQVADLQKQLEAAKQPQKQTEIQGTDRLNALISTAEKAKKAADSFFLRHPDLAPPELKQPEPPAETGNPFRGEGDKNPDAQPQDDRVSAAEASETVGEQFQAEEVGAASAVSESAGQDAERVVRYEEFESLVRRVEGLEAKANMMGAA